MLLTHPDRTPDPNAHARYFAINAAYEVLSDPSRRFAYDAKIQPWTVPVHRLAEWPARCGPPRRRGPPLSSAATRPPSARFVAYALAMRVGRPVLIAVLLHCLSVWLWTTCWP